MFVMGLLDGEVVIDGVLKDCQYFCSAVIRDGPDGRRIGARGLTCAAIVLPMCGICLRIYAFET